MEKRKQVRLLKYNYAQNGGYFITVCVKDMKCILGKIKPTEENGLQKTCGETPNCRGGVPSPPVWRLICKR